MRIGFIGLGNMATAMIGGIIKKGLYQPAELIGSAKTAQTVQSVSKQYGIETCTDNQRVAACADVLVLAVKPVFLPEVIAEIKDSVDDGTLVISIAAGKTIAWLEEQFGKAVRLVRCMPNTPALVGEACTCVCLKEGTSKEDEALVLRIMESFGTASVLPERLINAFTGVAGSSPAYVFLFLEALADAAVCAGIPRKQAYEFAGQSLLGSAKLMLETGMHPGQLKDMVCSPAGTTIEAVKVLEEKGLRAAVMDAVAACVEKAESMR